VPELTTETYGSERHLDDEGSRASSRRLDVPGSRQLRCKAIKFSEESDDERGKWVVDWILILSPSSLTGGTCTATSRLAFGCPCRAFKREAGEKPARSRHCIRTVLRSGLVDLR
jgi:hypothetical protein